MNEDFVRRMSNRLYAEKGEDESNNTFAMDMANLTEGLADGYEDYESVGTTEFEGETYSTDEDAGEEAPPKAKGKEKEVAKKTPPKLPSREPATPKPMPKPKVQTKPEETKPRGPALTVDESMSVKKTEAVVKQMMKETKEQRKESLGLDPAKSNPKAKARSAANNNISTSTMKSTVTDASEESQTKGRTRKKGSKKDAPKSVMTRRKSKDEQKVEKKSTFDTMRQEQEEETVAPRKQGSLLTKSRFTRKRGRRTKKKDLKEVAEKVQSIYSEDHEEEFEFRNPEVKDVKEVETANFHEMLNYGVQNDVLKATGGVKAVIKKQKEQTFPEAQDEDSDVES